MKDVTVTIAGYSYKRTKQERIAANDKRVQQSAVVEAAEARQQKSSAKARNISTAAGKEKT